MSKKKFCVYSRIGEECYKWYSTIEEAEHAASELVGEIEERVSILEEVDVIEPKSGDVADCSHVKFVYGKTPLSTLTNLFDGVESPICITPKENIEYLLETDEIGESNEINIWRLSKMYFNNFGHRLSKEELIVFMCSLGYELVGDLFIHNNFYATALFDTTLNQRLRRLIDDCPVSFFTNGNSLFVSCDSIIGRYKSIYGCTLSVCQLEEAMPMLGYELSNEFSHMFIMTKPEYERLSKQDNKSLLKKFRYLYE